MCNLMTNLKIIFIILIFGQTIVSGQTAHELTRFSKTECIKNCKEKDTTYIWTYSKGILRINFGRYETCNSYDTALIRTKADTLRIRIGTKKYFKTYKIDGKEILDFGGEPDEECDCFCKYTIEISRLTSEPQAIIIGKHLFISRKRISWYRQIW